MGRNFSREISLRSRRTRLRGGDRVNVPVEPDDALAFLEEALGKKSGAAVGVDQKSLVRRNQRGDGVGQVNRNGIVRLRKDARSAVRA